MKLLYKLAIKKVLNEGFLDLNIHVNSDGHLNKLKSILFSGEVLNDQEAMLRIYGKVNPPSFSALKSRMKDILIKSITVQNKYNRLENDRINVGINVFRETLASRVLLDFKERTSAIGLLENSIEKSIKYEITENVVSQCKILVHHYSVSEYNRYKFKKYSKLLERYLYYFAMELKAQTYSAEILNMQISSFANASIDHVKRVKKYIEELDKITNVNTLIFNYEKFRLRCAYYELHKDYDSILNLCKLAEDGFGHPYLVTGEYLSSVQIRKLWALIQANKPLECIKIGNIILDGLLQGSVIWYIISNYVVKANLYSGKYIEALEILRVQINSRSYKQISNFFQELIQLTLGYVHLIFITGIMDYPKYELPVFRIGKFMNNSPIFSKDKKGINVSVLLLNISFLLLERKFDRATDVIESLNRYAGRYLRKDDTFRSNCIIKMLVQMAKADFHPIKTERYTANLRKQLDLVPVTGSGGNIEVEIIPFEVLWDILMKAIQPVAVPRRRSRA